MLSCTRAIPRPRRLSTAPNPLVVGQTRAILLVPVTGSALELTHADGRQRHCDGSLAGDRANLMRQAALEPRLVSGLITDGLRHRISLALGPGAGRGGWIVYQENAIDPYCPIRPRRSAVQRNSTSRSTTSTPRDDQLVLAASPQFVTSDTAPATVPVGVDQWLVVVGTPRPLVRSSGAGPVDPAHRRHDRGLLCQPQSSGCSADSATTLALVDERFASLQSTVADLRRSAASAGRSGSARRTHPPAQPHPVHQPAPARARAS